VSGPDASRVAVITGVTGGIGRACAVAFMEAGWDVAGLGRAARPEGLPGRWYGQVDLGLRTATERLRSFFAEVGRIDALVNNAALQVTKPVESTADADWAAVMATNAAAPFVAIREAIPYLRAARGAVVNVASVHALATSGGVAAYAASKGALVALTRSAAVELGPDGVRVNALIPGAVDTKMLRRDAGARLGGSDADAGLAALAARTPLGRIGRPEEIAQAVLFLADGERSSFITGQALVADGGVLARLASE
jgi:NAD(P)-dependent dehydrogenase (short-subunit alcohol dehydrogenase family)